MKPKLFDIHSHLNFSDFNKDREEIIEKMKKSDVWTVCIGTDRKTSQECVGLAEKHENIFASVGLHPTDVNDDYDDDYYRNLAQHPKVVAIGECGLDYHRDRKQETRDKQKEIFKKQIELARELDKPLMIHCRDSHEDLIEILDSKLRGNIHFFSGDWEIAQKYFALGFTISFAGPITFSNQYNETIKKAPLDKIMVETDAPFAAPVPYRGKRSEPLHVGEIAKKIAEIRGESYEKIAEATTKNALRFFSINN